MKAKVEIKMGNSYKLGVDEVVGLTDAMAKAFNPVKELIKSKAYWHTPEFEPLEYKSRDGFIAHSHNHGGLELNLIVPRCEEYDFSFLEFGECDGCNEEGTGCRATEPDSDGECGYESEGHLDARLRVILMFEGINEDGELEFYINACGGNGDAPYFRLNHLTEIFEASFTCKSVQGVGRAAAKHIKKLLKALGGN